MDHSTGTRTVGALPAAAETRTLRAYNAIAALGFVAIAAACHSSPSGPTQPRALRSVTIAGPPIVAPGQTVSFGATGGFSDGTFADYTLKVSWTASPTSVLTISPAGQATGQAPGDATVQATTGASGPCCSATSSVLVLPPNTYRLVGKVLEQGLPVENASVVVLTGVGTGLSATTDYSGGYRLYGVAGPIQIKFSKLGYDDIVKPFTVARNDVLDFPEAHQTAAIPSLSGAYTLTVTADPACPVNATAGPIPPLEAALRTPRTYAASLTQYGPALTVTLTDSTIVRQDNQFPGHITPDTIEFKIGDGYVGYDLNDGISEQLSSAEALTFGGTGQLKRSASVLAGSLNGVFEKYDLPSVRLAEQCVATNHQFVLARAVQPARHR